MQYLRPRLFPLRLQLQQHRQLLLCRPPHLNPNAIIQLTAHSFVGGENFRVPRAGQTEN